MTMPVWWLLFARYRYQGTCMWRTEVDGYSNRLAFAALYAIQLGGINQTQHFTDSFTHFVSPAA